MEEERGSREPKDVSKMITDLISFIKKLRKEKFSLRLKELLFKAHKFEVIKNNRILNQTNQLKDGERKFNNARGRFIEKCAKHGVKIDNHEELLTSENLAQYYYLSFDL
ncbi:MAG: hypothetical protein WAV11_01080 [Minisyncoccia bacterium]